MDTKKKKERLNLYLLSKNDILGIERWLLIGVTIDSSEYSWSDNERVVFLTETGSVSIPYSRVFKLEQIK